MTHEVKVLTVVLVMVAITCATVAVLIAEEPKEMPKEETVKGEVVDLWCFLSSGARGADHKECAITCAKAGNPIGIVDEQGNIYIAMGSKNMQPGKDILTDKMAATVTVTGKIIKKGGVQAIYISKVE